MGKILLVTTGLLCFVLLSSAQSVSISNDGSGADPSSMLEIKSANKGLLIPRVSLTATNAATPVIAPQPSLLVYNIASAGSGNTAVVPGYYYWSGTEWVMTSTYKLQQNINSNGKTISGDGSLDGLSFFDNGLVVGKGNWNTGSSLSESGAGTRLIWYPKKGAFRSGTVDGTQWNDTAIGYNSVALGWNTIARNSTAVAMGWTTTANGFGSVAMGSSTIASGDYSTAFGISNQATGFASTALGANNWGNGMYATVMGNYNQAATESSTAIGYGNYTNGYAATAIGGSSNATANYSTAIGLQSVAHGYASAAIGYQTYTENNYSIALGNHTQATGFSSIALGNTTIASGSNSLSTGSYAYASGFNSTAMGYNVSTNGYTGSFIIGDYSSGGTTYNTNSNQMMMRFYGGYALYSTFQSTVGVQLYSGGNSWSTMSDARRKENFECIDGEKLLEKLSRFKLGTWNYKGQDPKVYRHYGPMAQDFYAAFGSDKYGSIGNDTTINQADFDGINFIALQAIEKRTMRLKEKNDKLRKAVSALEKENAFLKSKLAELDSSISREHLLIYRMIAKLEALATKEEGKKVSLIK